MNLLFPVNIIQSVKFQVVFFSFEFISLKAFALENLFCTHISTIATIAMVWLGRVGSKASVLGFFWVFFHQLELLRSGCCHTLAHKSVIHRDFSKHQNCGRENITLLFLPARLLINWIETMYTGRIIVLKNANIQTSGQVILQQSQTEQHLG